MNKSSKKQILSASQVIPGLLVVAFLINLLITKECKVSCIVNLLLIEIAFLFPSILFIGCQPKIKKINKETNFPDKYLLFSYLKGLSISILITLIILLAFEISNLYTINLDTGSIVFALISPFTTTFFAIKQSS